MGIGMGIVILLLVIVAGISGALIYRNHRKKLDELSGKIQLAENLLKKKYGAEK